MIFCFVVQIVSGRSQWTNYKYDQNLNKEGTGNEGEYIGNDVNVNEVDNVDCDSIIDSIDGVMEIIQSALKKVKETKEIAKNIFPESQPPNQFVEETQ